LRETPQFLGFDEGLLVIVLPSRMSTWLMSSQAEIFWGLKMRIKKVGPYVEGACSTGSLAQVSQRAKEGRME
jgi:hypothetical protein